MSRVTDSERRFSPSFGSDILGGFVGGVLAFVLGFVATALLTEADENLELAEDLIASTGPGGVAVSEFLPEWYQVVSWVFLENHQVSVSVSVREELGGDFVGEYTETLLPAASELQLLPPLLLAAAGFLVARRYSRTGFADAALAGATVVIGYLPGILALLYVASFEVVVPVFDAVVLEVSPALAQTVLIAGLAYPLVFGALGGLLAFAIEEQRK